MPPLTNQTYFFGIPLKAKHLYPEFHMLKIVFLQSVPNLNPPLNDHHLGAHKKSHLTVHRQQVIE